MRRQLSRWTKAGRLYQLRSGLYALAPPFQKVKPHPFVIANRMVRGSYVSCQSALAHYGLIPEHVPVVASVTTARPARWETPLGVYEFRHIKTDLLRGYRLADLGGGQQAFVATPEKALDPIHFSGDRWWTSRGENWGLLRNSEVWGHRGNASVPSVVHAQRR